MLDPIKAETSNFVIKTLLESSDSTVLTKRPEKGIRIADTVSSFDELNEHALSLKCKCLIKLGRCTLAKNTFGKFALIYKDIYGKRSQKSYYFYNTRGVRPGYRQHSEIYDETKIGRGKALL